MKLLYSHHNSQRRPTCHCLSALWINTVPKFVTPRLSSSDRYFDTPFGKVSSTSNTLPSGLVTLSPRQAPPSTADCLEKLLIHRGARLL